ncbi:WRKY DNA-binding transcription factor 70-like [Andrographis paniculata]|uniref:WRKY DNA-binding transcription factor 70-like n=1 Tax=Andrographis paniculata TaxID=175694 RepID=UPI0021E92511|nr:WRKY DNA-binding transcription factor 70-like [Andrographis paniculata]
MDGENLHLNYPNLRNDARKKRLIVEELLKGKEMAVELQTLLQAAPQSDAATAVDLSLQIFRSFRNTLSDLSFCSDDSTQTQIPAVDCRRKTNSPAPEERLKNRRGCYKRRKSSESWTVESSTTEDGFAWRKYGQKAIINSDYPRCYYRCTHKNEGCKATKQVQMIKKNPTLLYQTTYITRHSCSNFRAYNNSNLILCPSDSPEPENLISFRPTIRDDIEIINSIEKITSESISEKSKNHDDQDQSRAVILPENENDRAGVGYGLASSCESTSLQYYGMDDVDCNQFDSFFCYNVDDDQIVF